jgi:hypothetical protein
MLWVTGFEDEEDDDERERSAFMSASDPPAADAIHRRKHISKSMPSGDCVLRQQFIHRPGVIQGYSCVSSVVGLSPLPESVDSVVGVQGVSVFLVSNFDVGFGGRSQK